MYFYDTKQRFLCALIKSDKNNGKQWFYWWKMTFPHAFYYWMTNQSVLYLILHKKELGWGTQKRKKCNLEVERENEEFFLSSMATGNKGHWFLIRLLHPEKYQ